MPRHCKRQHDRSVAALPLGPLPLHRFCPWPLRLLQTPRPPSSPRSRRSARSWTVQHRYLCPYVLPPYLRLHLPCACSYAAQPPAGCSELTLAVPPVEQCLRSTSCSRRSSGTRSAPSSRRRLSIWRARCVLNAPAQQRHRTRHRSLLSAGMAGMAGSGWRSALRPSSCAAVSRMRGRLAQQMCLAPGTDTTYGCSIHDIRLQHP